MTKGICRHCKRPLQNTSPWCVNHQSVVAKAYVHHDFYGCDTGCCGHRVVGEDNNGTIRFSEFDFTHPHDDPPDIEAFVKDLVSNHLDLDNITIDWGRCEVSDD